MKAGSARILVAESNSTVAMVIMSLLRRWGYDAVRVAAGEMPTGSYDLVIADPMLRDPAIAELWRAVRATSTPWLALVSDADAHVGADADGWVSKSFRPAELREAVMRCLERPLSEPPASGIDRDQVALLWGSVDNPIYRQVCGVFLTEMATKLEVIAAATAIRDRRRINVEAHSAASASDNVGARALADAGRRLEHAAPDALWAEVEEASERLRQCARRDLDVLRRLLVAS